MPSGTFLVADVFSSNSALYEILALLAYSSKLRNCNSQLFRSIIIKEIRNGNEREDLVSWGTNQSLNSWLELSSHFEPSEARDRMEKVPDCLGHQGTDPPKNCLNTAGKCFVLSPFSFLISFTESPHKARSGANRLAGEGRILVIILKFHLEMVMRTQHLLEERKVAGADGGRWIGGVMSRLEVTTQCFYQIELFSLSSGPKIRMICRNTTVENILDLEFSKALEEGGGISFPGGWQEQMRQIVFPVGSSDPVSPQKLSCEHSPHTARFTVAAAWRASVKIQQSNPDVFFHVMPPTASLGTLVAPFPPLFATKVTNLWSLKHWQGLGCVSVTSTGSSQEQIPFFPRH